MDATNDDDLAVPRANNLTALRLVAALCVVVSHCALLRSGRESAEPFAGLDIFDLGDHALNAFFFISGLTVTASLARSTSVADFVAARILRLWPALLIVVIVTALIVAPLASDLSPRAYFEKPLWLVMIVKALVLSGLTGTLPGLFEHNPLPHVVNGSPWTLKFEALCYIGLLCGTLVGRRFVPRMRSWWIPASTIAAGVFMVVAPPGAVATTVDHLARFWVAFGLGATVYLFRAVLLRSAIVTALVSIAAGSIFVASIGGRFESVAAIVCVASLVVVVAQWPLGALRGLANRYDLSYGVYVTAWPITQLLVVKVPGMPLVALTSVVAGLAMALAFVSWTLIERPALRYRRRVAAGLQRYCVAPFGFERPVPHLPSVRRRIAGQVARDGRQPTLGVLAANERVDVAQKATA